MSFQDDIIRLKKENEILLIAHNYQRGDIQDAADYVGDSFGLARKVAEIDIPNVVFCGVDFMAESAVILNPDKRIIHPEPKARCPMAAMVDIDRLKRYREENPDAAVVSYVNTNVETKAHSDICCTSSNAVEVVRSLEEEKVLFLPDKNLGNYITRLVKDKEIELWEGYCATHDNITPNDIAELKEQYPDAEVIVHPECRPDVVDMADHVGSTAGILKRTVESDANRFIIGTEVEMGHRLKKESPDKEFYFPDDPLCTNMKMITKKKVISSMEKLEPVVSVEKELMERAHLPLKRMIEVGRGD
ncbi:MAG: quinolinate synthase NadA [Thermoplasmata archaeon]